jgi:acid stress-induced BolA-like protein IbaG/YrbA
MGREYDGFIKYPDSFNIRDTDKEISQLKTARETATDTRVLREIDLALMTWLGVEDAEAALSTAAVETAQIPDELIHSSLEGATRLEKNQHIQEMLMSGLSNDEILALHPELTLDDIVLAGAAAARVN